MSRHFTNLIHSDGKTYLTTSEMTEIFLKRARVLASDGHTELVPLPHRDGLEMILIGPDTLLMVSAIDLDSAGRHPETVDATKPFSAAHRATRSDADETDHRVA